MTTIDNAIDLLKLIGLDEKQAKVYLACLELGPSSVWQISQKSDVKRATCYQILEELLLRGFATKSHDQKRTVYAVVHPSHLLNAFESRKEQFRAYLPFFDQIFARSLTSPKIQFFEGLEGVRQAYMLGLDQPSGSEILIYGSPTVWLTNPSVNNAYIAKRLRKKIKLRAVFADKKENYILIEKDKKQLRETRFIPEKDFNPEVEVEIFGNFVIYIAYSEQKPFATVMENQKIADFERQKFELIWQIAQPYSK